MKLVAIKFRWSFRFVMEVETTDCLLVHVSLERF